jgi:hypothetical protein
MISMRRIEMIYANLPGVRLQREAKELDVGRDEEGMSIVEWR